MQAAPGPTFVLLLLYYETFVWYHEQLPGVRKQNQETEEEADDIE